MISTALAAVTAALDAADIYATIDSRNIAAPGCFVNVTKIDEFTLDDSARVTGTIVAVVKDLGGAADIYALNELCNHVLAALVDTGITVEYIETNHQASPPSGGKLPAIKMNYTVYI
ncbi:hypothetical protein [Corynebacterium propinquum]|uniref:hypothetical protein n=1 Tax=Corynebacterium propinquum TaxID=43769 RepID=UPI0011A30581|nr:hypothetical protein [Corynebacterium propinquum]DAE95871.1 MAG TPA: hypothetical protein [Caudoviricetes sp.]